MFTQQIDGFDWDEANWPKCGMHGVSREEIEDLFASEPLLRDDPFIGEKRTRAMGHTSSGRHLLVVFVLRQKDALLLIRPISARYMHQKEVEKYENL